MYKLGMGVVACLCIVGQVLANDVPEGAIVLFDGKDLSKWVYKKDGNEAKWIIREDGSMQVNGGDIITRDKFGDFKLHVEFNCPEMPDALGQARGNSGVYLQDRYEVQILDSYGLDSQDDDCGAIYKQKAPDVNACKKPREWQTYDITFRAARYDDQGKKTANPRVTVEHNGQVIHQDFEIKGSTGGGERESASPGPIRLQDHGDAVWFRNIWIIPLDGDKEGK